MLCIAWEHVGKVKTLVIACACAGLGWAGPLRMAGPKHVACNLSVLDLQVPV